MPTRSSVKTRSRSTPRRAEIIRIAGRLFAEKGFEAASLRDIGDAAGIRRGSLYAHFDAKEELMLELLLPPLERILEVLEEGAAGEGDGAQRLERCVQGAFECCLEHRDGFLILLQDRHLIERLESLREVSERARAVTRVWLQIISEGQADGSIRGDLAPWLVAQAVYSLLFGALSDRHVGLQTTTGLGPPEPAQLAHLLRIVLFEGLRGDHR